MFGFDFRYHALSLIAVLIALAVGLLLGVAIGDKGLVSSAETNLRQSLRGEFHREQQKASTLQALLNQSTGVQNDLYPLVVNGQLPGKRVAIVSIGSLPHAIVDDTTKALEGSGAQQPIVSVSNIDQPMNLGALASAASGTRYDQLANDPGLLLHDFGRRIAIQLADGTGQLLRAVKGPLLTSGSSGELTAGADAVVLYLDNSKLSPTDVATRDTFVGGFIEGLRARLIPVVGVEETSTKPSVVTWYAKHNLPTTVDDVDQLVGRVSLVCGLAGQGGNYGEKTGQLTLPPPQCAGAAIPPAATTTTATP
ncbi:MAG: hypothetical protein JWN32_4039 [Solirubrobacterales bacterium]|nr:hypothetical protein [Solirubrobacterales bacterium]